MYVYNARLLRVIDADTIVVSIDLGMRISRDITLRLADIDAPELKTPEGKASKQALIDFLADGNLIIKTEKDPGSYDRYTAVVYKNAELCINIQGQNVNKWLTEQGYASSYVYKWS
jgi:micrococcal nuclease